MDDRDQAYVQTVQAVVASVADVDEGEWGDRQWQRIVVNHESLLRTQEPQTSSIAFAIAQAPQGPLEQVDFRPSDAAEQGLQRVADIVHRQHGAYWTVCNLAIENDGRYKFDISDDAPYRLSGHPHDSRFDDYLQSHLADQR